MSRCSVNNLHKLPSTVPKQWNTNVKQRKYFSFHVTRANEHLTQVWKITHIKRITKYNQIKIKCDLRYVHRVVTIELRKICRLLILVLNDFCIFFFLPVISFAYSSYLRCRGIYAPNYDWIILLFFSSKLKRMRARTWDFHKDIQAFNIYGILTRVFELLNSVVYFHLRHSQNISHKQLRREIADVTRQKW